MGLGSIVGKPAEIPTGTRHKYALLQLHGASLNVLRSFRDATKAIVAMDQRTSSGELSTDEERSKLSAGVALFYVECNRHLQVVWPREDPLDLRKPEVECPPDPVFDRMAGMEGEVGRWRQVFLAGTLSPLP